MKTDLEWAALYSQTYCIYAVAVRWQGTVYWQPRMESGNDPDLGWLIDNRPTPYGWPSWAAAVYALGRHLDPAINVQ